MIEKIGEFGGLSGEALTRPQILELRIALARDARGVLIAVSEADEDAEIVEIEFGSLPGERLSAGALRAALERLPLAYAALGYRGILVSVDERALERGALELTIVEARVGEVRTLLRREGEEAIVNDARARRVHERVPLRAGSADEPGSLIDIAELDAFALRLSRHPNRRADIALSPGPASGREGDVTLDILLTESNPFVLYAQVSNTGTEQTSDYRQRLGIAHYNLSGNDDVLTIDYITGLFKDVNAVLASYERPLGLDDRLRGRVFGRYSRFDASELGALLIDFRGETVALGAELSFNAYQRGPAFLDLIAGARFEYQEVENTLGINTNNTFLLPYFGARFEERADAWSFDASVIFEFNLPGAGSTNDRTLDQLGRFAADDDWAVVKYDVNWSAYLDALFGQAAGRGRTSRVHEIALGVRGQLSIDSRLPPSFTDVAGGFYTVRGHPEAFTSGDRTMIASAEYRFHLPRALSAYDNGAGPGKLFGDDFYWRPAQSGGPTDWDLILRTFVDVGWVQNIDALPFEPEATLIGAGVGVELSIKRRLRARLDWGWVLKSARSANDRVEIGDNQAHLVFTVVF